MRMAGHVVVVEDAPAIAEVLGQFLGLAGYHVDTAADGALALETIATTTPDAVVTDVIMPNLSGTDLVRRMRASPRLARVPVVLFTGLPADNDDITATLALPLVRLVQKGRPFRLVVTAIEELRREAAASPLQTSRS
jgi:DNA-binding response OmpR family regulator